MHIIVCVLSIKRMCSSNRDLVIPLLSIQLLVFNCKYVRRIVHTTNGSTDTVSVTPPKAQYSSRKSKCSKLRSKEPFLTNIWHKCVKKFKPKIKNSLDHMKVNFKNKFNRPMCEEKKILMHWFLFNIHERLIHRFV